MAIKIKKENKEKLEKRFVVIIRIFIIIIFLAIMIHIFRKGIETETDSDPFVVPVNENQLIYESKEGYNTVKVYKQEKQLVINASSETAFFDGAQFIVETNSVVADDITVEWMTIGGSTVKTEDNERIIAEIIVKDNGEIVFDKKINFMAKGFDAAGQAIDENRNER